MKARSPGVLRCVRRVDQPRPGFATEQTEAGYQPAELDVRRRTGELSPAERVLEVSRRDVECSRDIVHMLASESGEHERFHPFHHDAADVGTLDGNPAGEVFAESLAVEEAMQEFGPFRVKSRRNGPSSQLACDRTYRSEVLRCAVGRDQHEWRPWNLAPDANQMA